MKLVIWVNGAFCSGKTQTAFELHRRIAESFVFDPENAGFYLRGNSPPELHLPDFREHAEWIRLNQVMLEFLCREYHGVLIVPMTVTKPAHCRDLIGFLRERGVTVRHFVIRAKRETLAGRRRSRMESGNGFAARQLEDCLYAFEHLITEREGAESVWNDTLTVAETAEWIADKCGVALTARQNPMRRIFSQLATTLRHIR